MGQVSPVEAGNQKEEDLADSVRSRLHGFLISDEAAVTTFFASPEEGKRWLTEMSERLSRILPDNHILQDQVARIEFLKTLHYEATRAGISPQLMLAIIHVESAFRKYAISVAEARGFMQVMPFWINNIGEKEHNLFKVRTNLRYGSVIFRHYLDIENGDVARALGRYNGSLGKAKYPNLVFDKLNRYWTWE